MDVGIVNTGRGLSQALGAKIKNKNKKPKKHLISESEEREEGALPII